MIDASTAPADVRRLTNRIASVELTRALTAMARNHGGDVFRYMVFTAIWTANCEHLAAPNRYAALHDIPPNSQRRPVSRTALQETLGVPSEILDRYIEDLIAEGSVESMAGGLMAPSAKFTEPGQLANANEFYARFVGLVSRLRQAGFGFGEPN